jgi:hypothetical protein
LLARRERLPRDLRPRSKAQEEEGHRN